MRTIVGDIGGTNTRLAVANAGVPEGVHQYLNREVVTLDECLEIFLRSNELRAAECALVLAVAAPTASGEVRLTNLDWVISAPALKRRFGFAAVTLVNDFVALAYALPALHDNHVIAVGGGRALADAPALVLGPGTGFGASIRLPDGSVIATEAGHSLISASSAPEAAVLARLFEQLGPVSVEQVLSGAGLVRLYQALDGADMPAPQPDLVAAAACAGRDRAAVGALALFFALLGLTARNLALACGARGGVYLAGGIVPRYAEALQRSAFRARFETPAPLPDYLEHIPTLLIVHPQPALVGLARHHTVML